jgi:hypothetical protein
MNPMMQPHFFMLFGLPSIMADRQLGMMLWLTARQKSKKHG